MITSNRQYKLLLLLAALIMPFSTYAANIALDTALLVAAAVESSKTPDAAEKAISDIISKAVAANPDQAEAIVSESVKVEPAFASQIAQDAVTVLPAQAGGITSAADRAFLAVINKAAPGGLNYKFLHLAPHFTTVTSEQRLDTINRGTSESQVNSIAMEAAIFKNAETACGTNQACINSVEAVKKTLPIAEQIAIAKDPATCSVSCN